MTDHRDEAAAVGFDVGGTNMRVALVSTGGAVLREARVPTPSAAVPDLLAACLVLHGEVTAGLDSPVLPVGVGIAAIVRDRRIAVHGPNLPLAEVDLVAEFGDRGLDRVVVENDANAAMFGEWRLGAAQGHDNALLVTIGTGVGGGAMVHGELLRGAHGFGGEAGHVHLVEGGRACPCGRRGCLEAYAAGSTLATTAVELIEAGGSSSLQELATIDGAAVSAAARAGDELAIATLVQVGHWLGVGLTSMVNLLDPSIVVVGGGAAADNAAWLLPAAQAVLDAEVEGAGRRQAPSVVPAGLGDDAGMIGAALLAMEAWPTGQGRDLQDTTRTTT